MGIQLSIQNQRENLYQNTGSGKKVKYEPSSEGMSRDHTGLIMEILKLSERHENFFPRVIFVVDFENDLEIDKIFAI